MSIMSHDVGALLLQTVPFARTLGITFDSVGDGQAVSRLPDRPDLHNHVAGPHAGALFTLAESASGAAMLSMLGDQLERAVPLATSATIEYRKLAKGEVHAEARLLATRDEVVAQLDAGSGRCSTWPSTSRTPTVPWCPPSPSPGPSAPTPEPSALAYPGHAVTAQAEAA